MREITDKYLQPDTLEKLEELLPVMTDKSAVLAGGTDLFPRIREGKQTPDRYISLCRIEDLKKIEEIDGWLKIGAMVTHEQAAGDGKIKQYFKALHMACSKVGSQQIRNKGTIGGNIVNASPAGDIMPCVFLYGGEVEIMSTKGYRRIKIEEFLRENGKTDLGIQEILTAVWLPEDAEKKSCFIKLGGRREVTIAQISLCASWSEKGGRKENIKVYAGAVDVKPILFSEAELLAQDREEATEQAASALRRQIKEIRMRRMRESKLKITEAEKLYKERAAKGMIYDLAALMEAEKKEKRNSDEK